MPARLRSLQARLLPRGPMDVVRQVLLFAPLPKPVLVVGERTLKKIHS